jgi:hypothetical protein
MLRVLPVVLLFLACATAPKLISTEGTPNWDMIADEGTVEVVTLDEDGSERVTTIWLAVVDAQGYIRTGNTYWFANLGRDPKLRLRAGGAEYQLKSEPVDDAALGARIDDAFRAKYGFSDRVVSLFRSSGSTKRMRLVAR